MSALSSPGPFLRAGLVAVLVATVWAITAASAPMPPVYPLGPQPVYVGTDAPALVAIEPVLHAAWLGTPTRPWVGVVALVVLLGASGVAIFSGATTLAAASVLSALVLDTSFSGALAHAAGLVLAVGLVWLSAGAAFDDRSRIFTGRPWFNPLSAMVLWALAVWYDWIAIVTWPVVWAAFRRTPDRPGRGWWTAASLVVGAAAFAGHFAGIADTARAATVGAGLLTWADAIAVAFDARPGMPIGSFAGPELTTRLGYLLMALAAVGLAFGSLGRWWRRTVLLAAALAVAVGVVWSEWQAEVLRFSLWALAPLSAVGLTWVASQGRRPAAVTLLLGAIAVTETVVIGARPMAGSDARGFRDVLAGALAERARAAPLVVVAEDTRIDSALMPWMAAYVPRVLRVPQDGEAVARARDEGRTVLAGPTGRRHLELAGVSFTRAFTIELPAPFVMFEADGTFRCVSVRADRWSQLPGLDYTGRLGIELPPSLSGELHLVVGDVMPLPLRAETADGREVVLREEPLTSGPGVAPPPADYWIDGGAPDVESRWIRRVRLAPDPLGRTLLSFSLERRAPRVIARLVGYGDEARARVCAAPLGETYLRDSGADVLSLGDESVFGAGWYGREGTRTDAFRWAGADAVVLLRSAVRADVEVRLDASPAVVSSAGEATTVTLRVNGIEAGVRAMARGTSRYTWQVPAGVWLAGTNELWWHTSRTVRPADTGGADTRSLGLRVTGISVSRASPVGLR
jgi:hypothetical protein